MKNIFVFAFASALFCGGVCQMPQLGGFTPNQSESYEIVMNNRLLVKLNGKSISVMDVKKKMDLILREHHPEALSSNLLLYQFYSQNWRPTLQEMIDSELIKMEAETFKINISDGDIRQEMDKRFGPNVVKKLDELSLTYDEAKELIHDEIIVRNMTWYRVYAKVLQDATPELVKQQYASYIQKHPVKDEWVYKMASIRGDDETGAIAKHAYSLLLNAGQTSLDKSALPSNVIFNVSDTMTVAAKDLSNDVLKVLENLPKNTYSEPISQKSRTDGQPVYRMFYVVDHKKDETPSFESVSSKIHETLIQHLIEGQRDEYFCKLRKRFLSEDLVVKNLFPESYQPFTICGS